MLIIYILCTLTLVIIPLLSGLKEQESRVYSQRLRDIRLTWVQKHYPELRKLSWEQIEREYPVTQLFNQIR